MLIWFASLFILAVLCLTGYLIFDYLIEQMDWPDESIKEMHLEISLQSWFFAMNIFLAGVDGIILVLYRKYADQIHDQAI